MPISAQRMKMKQRRESDSYNIELNQSTYDILSLIFEFKIASSTHVTRFFYQEDYQRYMYMKLRRMWQAGFLESFRHGPDLGKPLYYLLSERGLKALEKRGTYDQILIRRYPNTHTILRIDSLEHEKEIVDLASLEAKIANKDIAITFKGEISSGAHTFKSDKNIEVFTPDYSARYSYNNQNITVYTEYERTKKSKDAMLRKIERYHLHLDYEEQKTALLRIIFETENMEKTFWLNVLCEKPELLQTLKIFTTHLPLLHASEQFCEPVYATDSTVEFSQGNKLSTDISKRIKLFYFL